MYPNVVDYEMLEPSRRQIASYAKSNIIDKDGTLMRVFEKNARVVNTSARTIQWRIHGGEGDIRSTFIRSYIDDLTEIGKGNTVFEIGLDTQWFGPNDLLVFEGLRELPLLVKSEPRPDGDVYVIYR